MCQTEAVDGVMKSNHDLLMLEEMSSKGSPHFGQKLDPICCVEACLIALLCPCFIGSSRDSASSELKTWALTGEIINECVEGVTPPQVPRSVKSTPGSLYSRLRGCSGPRELARTAGEAHPCLQPYALSRGERGVSLAQGQLGHLEAPFRRPDPDHTTLLIYGINPTSLYYYASEPFYPVAMRVAALWISFRP